MDRAMFPQVASGEMFAEKLRAQCDYFVTVPDSVFRTSYRHLPDLVVAPRENHAVAEAFGARLGGRRPCVLMQNSGLGLALDALIGLFRLYEVGLLLVVSSRGELPWEEVQHREWGTITHDLLEILGVRTFDLGELGLDAVTSAATASWAEDALSAVVVHRGNLDEAV